MKIQDIIPCSFQVLRQRLGLNDPDHDDLVKRSRSNDSELCREMVGVFGLSESQMLHAAERYRLGCSRSGKTIYWMIDEQGFVCDGHIGTGSIAPDSWVSTLLQRRYPELAPYLTPIHGLFGQHLLGNTDTEVSTKDIPVCVVESERTAVVFSELFPERLWLAYVYPANLTVQCFKPLQGRTVILFSSPDPTGEEYLSVLDFADQVRCRYPSINLRISAVFDSLSVLRTE